MSSVQSEEIDQKILSFITEMKGKANKNKVVHYMDSSGLLSRVPTLNKLKELESSGRINVSKNNRRGQAQYLTINNQSAYNRIYNWLTDVEDTINQMYGPLNTLDWSRRHHYYSHPETEPPSQEAVYLDVFMSECVSPIEKILEFLYILTNKIIQSEKNSQVLNGKIVDLLLRLRELVYSTNQLGIIDAELGNDISSLECYLQPQAIDGFTNAFEDITEAETNLQFTYNLIEKIKKFRKEFIENFDTI